MFIDLHFNDVRFLSISKSVDSLFIPKILKYNSYYEFYCEEYKLNPTLIENKVKFKDSINAKFALATKWAIFPKELQAFVKDSCVNHVTGDRFYLFK
jgi:hypothetical protein